MNFHISLLSRENPPCYVITALWRRRKVTALNKMSSNATPLQTFCQSDRHVKFIRSRNPDHNSQKSWLITKLLLEVTSNKKRSSVIGQHNKFRDSCKPFNHFAKQNMIWTLQGKVKLNWSQFLEIVYVSNASVNNFCDWLILLDAQSQDFCYCWALFQLNFKPSLFSAFNYGFENLAKQSSWRSILFCVHDHIHRSETAAMFAQLLSSLLERDSTDEWPPWYHNLPRM